MSSIDVNCDVPSSFHAFHSILLHTLESFIEKEIQPTQVELGALLAVLPRLPFTSVSTERFDNVHSSLVELFNRNDWNEVLSCDCTSPFFELDIILDDSTKNCSSPSSKGIRRVGRWNLRDSADGESDFEDNAPIKKKKKKINVSECILLSDSDGFAAHLGDFPPPGDTIEKDEVESGTIYYMYKNIFHSYPTYFSPIQSTLNALALVANLSRFTGYSKCVSFLCDLVKNSRVVIDNLHGEDIIRTLHIWLNWLRISRQIALSTLSISTLAINDDRSKNDILHISTTLVHSLIKDAIMMTEQMCTLMSTCDTPCIPRSVVTATEAINDSVVFLVDKCLALIEMHEDRKILLTDIGELIVTWLDNNGEGSEWAEFMFISIERRLGYKAKYDSLEQRFIFETLASLIDSSNIVMVNSCMDWLLHLPFSLSSSISGSELFLIILPHLSSPQNNTRERAIKILNQELPRMEWIGKEIVSNDCLPSDCTIYPSRSANQFAFLWRTTQDLKPKFLYSLFKYMSSVDIEIILEEGVIPRVVSFCQQLSSREVEPHSPTISKPGELIENDRILLQTLEVIAFELKTTEAAITVVKKILRPYCDILVGMNELRDVFFGISLRSSTLALPQMLESGMIDWLLNRLDICLRSASTDIWTMVEDSAILFYRQFAASLSLVDDILEYNKDGLSSYSSRILSLTSSIVDLCFEWTKTPSSHYSNTWRIANLMATALSSHLTLSSDKSSVMDRFSKGFLKSLGSPPSSHLLISISLTLFLDMSVARRIPSTTSRLSIDCDTDNAPTENEEGKSTHGSYGRRAILKPELVVGTLTMLQKIVECSEGSDVKAHRTLEKVCRHVRVVERGSDEEKEWIGPLSSLCISLLSNGYPSYLLSSPLICLSRLLLKEKDPIHLNTFIQFFHNSHSDGRVKYTVLNRLRWMLNREKGCPSEYLVFPQVGVTQDTMESSSLSLPSSPSKSNRSKNKKGGPTILKRLLRSINSDSSSIMDKRIERSDSHKDDYGSDGYSVGAAASLRLNGRLEMRSSDGLSLSTWIRTLSTPNNERLPEIHLLSIGGDALCVTLSINTKRGQLWVTTRVGDMQIKRERVRGLSLGMKDWHHIVFGMKVSTNTATIIVSVDSLVYSMDTQLLFKMDRSSSFSLSVQLGSISRRLSPHYFLANMFGFQGLLSHSHIIVLSSLGCDLTSLAETKLPHVCSTTNVVSPRLVSHPIPLQSAISDTDRIIVRLQRQLVFCIRVSSATTFGVSELPPDIDQSYLTQETALSMAFLNEEPIVWKTRLVRSSIPSLHSALSSIGSLKLLIYLLAKTVNDSQSSETQRAALQVVLTASQLFPLEAKQLKLEKIICAILSSNLAKMNNEMVEVLLDHCISREKYNDEGDEEDEDINEWIDDYERGRGQGEGRSNIDNEDNEDEESTIPFVPSFMKDNRDNEVIRDPKLLLSLSCCHDLWMKRDEWWKKIISRIASLVDEKKNSSFEFNRFQLTEISALNRLVHMILKQLSLPDSSITSNDLVDNIILIFHSLLGSPEKYEAVVQIWYFIFLSHPASSSFIDQRIDGHSSWLKPDVLYEKNESELVGDSQLCQRLKNYVTILGKDYVHSKWNTGVSIFDIRKEYEEAIGISSEDDGIDRRSERGIRIGRLPDLLSDIGIVSEDCSHIEVSSNQYEHSDWVIRLRSGVLNLFSNVLQNGADGLLQCLIHDVVSWQAILVLLTKQKDIRIREAVLCTLEKFLLRSNLFTKMTFIEFRGFEMLSSQLKGGPVSSSIADSLFSIMCGETIRLGDGLDESRLSEMVVDRLSCGTIHAVFVLFSLSVNDIPLFWNVTNALLKMYEVNSQLQAAMSESSLGEVMVNVLLQISKLPQSESEVITSTTSSMVSTQLECWMSFAQRIVVSSYPYNDSRVNGMCDRFLLLLQLADWHSCAAVSSYLSPSNHSSSSTSSSSSSSSSSTLHLLLRSHSIIRSQFSQLLHCCMESIRTVFSDEGRSASASSSIDSIPSLSSSPADEYDLCDDLFTPERAMLVHGTSPFSAFVAGSFANLREKITSMGPISRHSLRCIYRRRRGCAPLASLDSLLSRVLYALDTSMALFSVHPQAGVATEEESNLFHFCLYLMLTSWGRQETKTYGSRSETVWQKVVISCKERVRVVLAQLVAFVLFPAQSKLASTMEISGNTPSWLYLPVDMKWSEERRRQLVKALSHELQYKRNLAQLLSVNLDYEFALCLGIYELALLSPPVNDECKSDIERMIHFLRSTKVGSPLDKLTPDCLNNLTTDEILSMHSYVQHRKSILATLRSKLETIRDEEAVACAQLEQHAMNATCEIVEELSTPRRMNLQMTRDQLMDIVEADKILKSITKEVCHPEGSGFDSISWPLGYALERRESVNREKRRLSPSYYSFDTKFFDKSIQDKMEKNKEKHPLENLFKRDSSSSHHRHVLGEGVRVYLDATLLCATFECMGELLVAENEMHFSGDRARSTQKGVPCPPISVVWKYSQITEIHNRNHLLKDVALEIFLDTGETYLVVFDTVEKRAQLRTSLEENKLGHLFTSTEHLLQAFTQTWRHGGTTNFDYLMQLNKLAGRSFNDLMQYPVFPFVLADYSSAVLDLSKSNSFRALSRPMAIQDRSMEEHYAANYRCLEESSKEDRGMGGPLHFGPYHYGSHYSNCGIVVHYLVRVSPFTQIALEYQDNNFDIPDRLFNSIEATWRLASRDSTTDFKELIPEFFFLSEMLQNRDRLELGTRQGGERVGDVKLPTWTPSNNPRLFILIHRQALESSYVTSHLHQWIDLIFGYKQQGPAALKALNVFHPATYLGHLDADSVNDELSQSALKTMVKSYGQMPLQLLHTSHPPHAGGIRRPDVKNIPGPLPTVIGLRWGDFVGSPDEDSSQLQVVLSVHTSPLVSRLLRLQDGSVVGVPRSTITISTKLIPNDNDTSSSSRRQLDSLSILSYSFSDRIIRLRSMKPQLRPWVNIMQLDREEVHSMIFSASSSTLFVALTHGVIRTYQLHIDNTGVRRMTVSSELLAHSTSVSSLFLCEEYGIIVSGCSRGKVVMWHTQRRQYIRTLIRSGPAVTALCISRVCADVAVVTQATNGYGSRVELFTVNGDLVGGIDTESTVTCIAMTDLPEGTAINTLALGMQSGKIKLVEMWTMSVVREISHTSYTQAIISISFSSCARKLLVALSSGRVLCWQNVSGVNRSKGSPFQMIDPFV